MHHRSVIIRKVGFRENNFLKIDTTSNISVNSASSLFDIVPFYSDIFVTVGPLSKSHKIIIIVY